MQGVKEKALELLLSGKAQRVLGWKKGEFFYDLTPGTFESVQEVEREFQYGVFAGANLSKYCIAESKKRRRDGGVFKAVRHILVCPASQRV